LHAFNQMQANSQQIFVSSVQGFQLINTVKKNLDTIENNYLQSLAGQKRVSKGRCVKGTVLLTRNITLYLYKRDEKL
jgi:hypothetical protein